ncbi:14074_t:CDS:2 [Acaulospora morrowiae]|uniref:14074_t:CDS:1 n=1 Tax=Acaulospora morrowiae TaxID=94023 RepID=A0A9N9FTH8_9GLOM|nr:14074_t:CDS:2 [Acaulospora morrowiae]
MICVIDSCKNSAKDEDHELCPTHLNIWIANPSVLPSTIRIQNSTKYTNLVEIPKGSPSFLEVEKKFMKDWVKPNANGVRIEAIYNIYLHPEIVQNYKNYRAQVEDRGKYKAKGLYEGNEMILYHGTDHLCSIIFDTDKQSLLCKGTNCGGCGILMNGFDMAKEKPKIYPLQVGQNNQGRSFQRLGQGLYFTPYSSKAHYYGHGGQKVCPNDSSRTCRIMFMSKIVVGNPWQPHCVSQDARGPPEGFDSTWGKKGNCPHGSSVLVYEEYAIYRHDACLPVRYIAYSYTSTVE